MQSRLLLGTLALCSGSAVWAVEDFPKPFSPPCVERENVFEFSEKPAVRAVGEDKYEIAFKAKGYCDVTVAIVDGEGKVVRHLAAGVLGANAPAPFQKNSLKQTLYWNSKDDLDWYPKNPENLKVRVMLGLKPEFENLLLGKSPKNLSPSIWGIAVGADGAYLFSKGNSGHGACTARLQVRKFDHDGNYVMSLLPPAANMPLEKLGGVGFIEYEPGLRALHGVPADGAIQDRGWFWATSDGPSMTMCQPFLLGQKLHFLGRPSCNEGTPYLLHRMNQDGSTAAQEISTPLGSAGWQDRGTRMAPSPDGKWLYLVAADSRYPTWGSVVMREPMAGGKATKVFLGDPKRAPGSDNQHFQAASGLDCDATGRLYVSDTGNNRIQIFSPEGQHLKTLSVERPDLVRVHPKTGALYVIHQARIQGKSLNRMTKFSSFETLEEEWHMDHVGGRWAALAVDAWTAKTRLWLGNGGNVILYEEDDKKLRVVADFNEEAKKEEGGNHLGHWGGEGHSDKVVCDPVREQVYFRNSARFDLKTGTFLGNVRLNADDIAFDKRGYVHLHFNPSHQPGVGRLDPSRPGAGPATSFPECPYDYGEEGTGGWIGIIKTKDQLGAKFFQDGVGVNMRGDVVEQCNIYYVPKMEAEGEALAMSGAKAQAASGLWCEEGNATNDRFVKEMERRGETVYSIRRESGIPLMGGTIWTFEWNGELRQECAVNTGELVNGVQLDNEGAIYFVVKRNALRNGHPFLAGRGGTLGVPGDKRGANPLIGTLLKTSSRKTQFLMQQAPVRLDERPNRPPDFEGGVWVEGMAWLYAGASPLAYGCSCPTQRLHVDWYQRTFVPEAYRHSFGVLDTAGNVIMHLGRYGNYDSGNGAKSRLPIGGDNIALYMPRFISGTDRYLVFSDWGERLAVLKIAYQVEESVPILAK